MNPEKQNRTIQDQIKAGVKAEKEVKPIDEAIENALREQDSYCHPQTMSERLAWETLQMQIKDNKSERKLRRDHATKTFWFTVVWTLFIIFIILLKGFKCITLDRVEFLSVIGALTASVFGFYLFVMKFLFAKMTKDEKSAG